MEARWDLFTSPAGRSLRSHVISAAKALASSKLPATIRELVSLRISQINGCGFCVDMHTKDATARGEDPARLHMVAVWREATVFTDAERAALELAEQGTRIADAAGGVTDEVWQNAVKHFDEEQLVALLGLIAFMNAVNRLNVITRRPAGSYQPGQFD